MLKKGNVKKGGTVKKGENTIFEENIKTIHLLENFRKNGEK